MKVLKWLLPVWWFTRRFFGSSKLRPFGIQKWWEGHRKKFQPDWEEFCKRSPREQKLALEDKKGELAALTDELKGLPMRATILGAIATAVLAANIFLIKDGNPSLMWLVKVAFVPLALNFALLLFSATPPFSSIYKQYPSASDWQRLIRGPQDRFTRLMMLIDRYGQRADGLKAYQIRATVLLFAGGVPMGAALILR